MKRTSKLVQCFILAIALLIAALPLTALAEGDLEATVRAYLIGDNNGASAAGTFPDGTKRNVGAADVNANYDTYTFLDIRLDEQYDAGHIAGAYHIPYGLEIAENFKYIPLDKPVIVVSNDGQLSWQLTGALNAILENEGIDTKIICWQGGYVTEGIDADKISTEAVALPTEQNDLSEAGNQLLADYFAALADAKWDNFIIDEAATWEIIDGIRNNKKEYLDEYAVALLPAFGGTYVGKFNDSIFRSDYGGEAGANTLLGISKDKTVLVACGSGQTSDNVVGALRVLGYDA
ncbi:MAG: rhodanese-like domain-containing protein, partial [Clostridia bacterium]|nr:rhodanese-like domain-containing protein [Clostridia bacterium]